MRYIKTYEHYGIDEDDKDNVISDLSGNTYEIRETHPYEFYLYTEYTNEQVGHIKLAEELVDGYYSIKDTYITPKLRGNHMWKPFMKFVLDKVKENYGAKGLMSYGYLRRPDSNRAWKSIEKYVRIEKPESYSFPGRKKVNYYLENLPLYG
jgi:hypothetical protein